MAVATILVTSDLDVVEVGTDVVVGVGIGIITAVVDVSSEEVVGSETVELVVDSVLFSEIGTLDVDVTGGGVEVGISVVVFDGTSDDDGGSVDDTTGGVVDVPFAIGVEDGVTVIGTLTVSDVETGTSVLFPVGSVGAAVEEVGSKVDVGPVLSVEFDVGAKVDVGTKVVDSDKLDVGPTLSVEFDVGAKVDVGGNSLIGVDNVGVADDSVELAVGPGSTLVKSPISPLVELELGVGVASEVELMMLEVEEIVGVAVSVSSTLVVALVEDAVTVAFEVGEPETKVPTALVRSSIKPLLLEVDTDADVEVAVGIPVEDGADVEDGVDIEDGVDVEDGVDAGDGVDVAVTTPVGNRRIPDEEDVRVDVGVAVESLVASSETEAEAEVAAEVAFAMNEVDESEPSPKRGSLRVGRDSRVVSVVVASLLTVEDPVEVVSVDDPSSVLDTDLVVDVLSVVVVDSVSFVVAVVSVFESVSLLELEPVADGITKTVVGITIVVVPLSSSEDVSLPRSRLARMSDSVSLLVDDNAARSVEVLD